MRPWAVGVIVLLFTWSLTTHGKYSVSGDEPHYLMVAESLRADRDLDVLNNYAQDDGRLFGHEKLEMEAHARVARDGRTLPAHDIGLPLLILPAYVTAERLASIPGDAAIRRVRMNRGLLAYSIVSTCLIVLTAGAAALLFAALAPLAGARNAAIAVVAAALSPPIVSHAFLVFPEVPAFAVTCLVVWFALKADVARAFQARAGGPERTVLQTRGNADVVLLLVIAAALGLLPWMHRKYSFYVFGLAALVVWTRRELMRDSRRAELAVAAALFLLPQLALHAWTVATWGSLGGPQMLQGLPFTPAGIVSGTIGLFADRTSGLLAYAPIYWIVPASCVLTWRRTWPFVAVALLLALPMASFVEWWAGFAPAARYIMPTMPLLLVPVALASRHRAIRASFYVLIAAQAVVDGYVWQHPRALWPAAAGTNAALDRLGPLGRAYEWILPPLRLGVIDWRALAVVVVLTVSAMCAGLKSCATRVTPSRQA